MGRRNPMQGLVVEGVPPALALVGAVVQQAFEDYRAGPPEWATEALAWLLGVAPDWLRWARLADEDEGEALVLERLARERGGDLADMVAEAMEGLGPWERRRMRAALLVLLPATVAAAREMAKNGHRKAVEPRF